MSDASDAFNASAAAYDRWFDSAEGRALFASEVSAILPHTMTLEHPFLEIGIGTGRFAIELGIDKGIDPSEHMLTLAKKRGIKATRAVGESIPFADESSGGVFILLTLCFSDAPEKVLLEARRVLKPGGCTVVGIITRESAWGELYIRKKTEGHPIYRNARFYSASELSAMLKAAGLQPEAATSSLFQPPSNNPFREEARPGLSEAAGIKCIRARK